MTELHLGFYTVTQKIRDDAGDSSDEENEDDKVGSSRAYIFPEDSRPCPGKPDWRIEKGVISVHFFGDLNDRYWTSHVLVNSPGRFYEWLADYESFNLAKPSGQGNKNSFHSQRKILEARWFADATKLIADKTEHVLEYVANVIGKDVSLACTHRKRD